MFTGSIVALVTPMDENGNVCRTSLKKLIDYHVANGTSAIVSVGTTGESATLSHEEHGDVVLTTLELADGRVLHQVRHPQRLAAPNEAAVRVPVNAVAPPGQPATVVATVVLELADGASLRPSLWRTGGGAWAVVLLVAGLAALATWWGPARRWQAQHGLLLQALQPQAAPGDVARVPVDVLADVGGAGPLAPALEALAQGDAQLARAQAAVHSYAQELLAMDFDASL